jgi:hypothetical protein
MKSHIRIKVYVVISIAVFCLIISACSRERAWKKRVETVKAYIPEAIEFIEENEEMLNKLLDVKQRIKELNNIYQREQDGDSYKPLKCSIYIPEKNETHLNYKLYPAFSNKEDVLQKIFTEADNDAILSILNRVKNNLDDSYFLKITEENVSFVFKRYDSASLFIESPPQDIDDTESYSWYTYAEHVTDDWGIYLFRWNMGI